MGAFILVFCLFFAESLAGKHDIYSGFRSDTGASSGDVDSKTWPELCNILRSSVYGVNLQDRTHQEVLYNLQLDLDVDVWKYGVPKVTDALVMVSPQNKDTFLESLDENGIEYYVHLSDVASALEESDRKMSLWRQSRINRMVPFSVYPTYAEVDEYMERLAIQYPNLVTLVNAGLSFEGRPIKYLKISTTNFNDTSKPIYFLDATMHAREWVTTPVALYTIHRLVEDLREEDRDLLEDTDWIIMPIVNPDGYIYSHTTERLWRRTRSYNATVSTECWGVDANRNFDINFNTIGVSTNPCSNTYPGHEPFSEPEIGYVRDILLEYANRMEVYLDVHSQGNMVLFAYGDGSLPPNVAQIHHLSSVMGAAIDTKKLDMALYYVIGNSNLILYGTSGTAQDYGQAVGVPFSLTLELPGYGYGHDVPPEFIEQINIETYAGIAESARVAKFYYQMRRNQN